MSEGEKRREAGKKRNRLEVSRVVVQNVDLHGR